MKTSVIGFMILSSLAMSACSTAQPSLRLDPVGPAHPVASAATHEGSLIVYSAYEVNGGGPAVPDDIRRHSSFRIFTAGNGVLRIIANQTGPFGEEPETLALAPGTYEVSALANGYGLVTVPAIVAEGKLTEIHLEGGAGDARIPKAAAVKLPSGQIIGWKAASAP